VRPYAVRPRRNLGVGGFSCFAVVLSVELGGFAGVMHGVVMMAIGDVRVMSGKVMIPRFVVPRSLLMMMGGPFMVFCCIVVMLCGLLGHTSSSKLRNLNWADGS
jgi:hypothetical protein